MNIKSSELEIEYINTLTEKIRHGKELLHVAAGDTPQQMVIKIDKAINCMGTAAYNNINISSVLEMGSLWGQCIVDCYGWLWQYLEFADETEGVYIVSPKRYYCCSPINFINSVINEERRAVYEANGKTPLMLFNLLACIENEKPVNNYQKIV